MNDLELKGTEFKREMLRQALNKCKPENIDLFNRMYGSVETIPEYKMSHAYTQITNTLKRITKEGKQ